MRRAIFRGNRRRSVDDAPRRTLSVVAGLSVVIASMVGTVLGGPAPASAACDAMNISSVGVERCVVPGHQAEIDAGNVVRVDSLSTTDGHWLAGHRSTHGSTFGPLTDMEIGDVVSYRGQRYEIVEYTTARFASPGSVLDWTKRETPTVVLQTSVDSTTAHLWRAEAIPAHTVDDETPALLQSGITIGTAISTVRVLHPFR